MPRLSPAAPSMVSSTMAKALMSSRRSRRSGSAMRISDIPMPKRRSLVSRKLGSMVQRREYRLITVPTGAAASLVARHHGSFMSRACTQTTAPT